jgi:ferric-dicitrate binding protein FerR (iron transport regulator)
VILESGTLSINVAPAASVERRLVVLLPDGELEDIGTTFSVSAHAGRTSGVSVQHGSVVLRCADCPRHAQCGESWQPSLASVPVPASSSQAPLRR